jgi:hypothetical protein
MSKQEIYIGAAPNDGTGDPIRTAMSKVNANFTEVYEALEEVGLGVDTAWDDITGKPTFAAVATTGDYDDLTDKPTLGTAAARDGWTVPAGGTVGQVLVKVDGTDGNTEWDDQTGGGGGIADIVSDTTPQLGGNLDLNGFTVGAATAADLTKLNALTATSTELNYVDGVTSAIQTQLDTLTTADSTLTNSVAAKVASSLFDANTILAATTDNTPAAVTVGEQTLVGRITAGNITALTTTQVRTLLNVEDGATNDMTAAEIAASLETLNDTDSRTHVLAMQGLGRANATVFTEGDMPVAGATDGLFTAVTPLPLTPATALQIAAGTDEDALLTAKNVAMWYKQTTLTMANPATIDWSGAESGGSFTGHSRNVLLTCTGTVAVQVGAIAPGLEGLPFLISVINSGGGAKTVTFQTHATSGATLKTATGVTNPGLGTGSGDRLLVMGVIRTVGTTGGIWTILRYAQVVA